MREPTVTHVTHAEALRARIADTGVLDRPLRVGARDRASTGSPLPDPYDDLARLVDEASYRVTDGQIAAVRAAAGSEKAAFELVFSTAAGAGLLRWDAARRAIEGATDATA